MSEITSYSHSRTNQKVLELVTAEDPGRKTVLDVGAGEGYFVRLLSEHLRERCGVDPRGRVFACDLHTENYKYPEIECVQGDFQTAIPYEADRFDRVVSIEVIEHIEDTFAFLRELHRVTKPGGRAIVTTPNILNINSRLRAFYSGFALLFNVLPLDSHQPVHTLGHIHPIGLYYLGYAFRRAGFREVRLHYDRRKRSATFLAAFFYPWIRIQFALFRSLTARKAPDLVRQNEELLRPLNSWDTLTSRTLIVEGIK
jgi:SAM-dependent methyltransferase